MTNELNCIMNNSAPEQKEVESAQGVQDYLCRNL